MAKVSVWGTPHSAAAWLATTQKGDPYIALRLTSEEQSQSEKIRLAIWREHARANEADPHFRSVQEVYGYAFALCAWLQPSAPKANGDDSYQLELIIEPVTVTEETDALRVSKQGIADFLATEGMPALPPMQNAPPALPPARKPVASRGDESEPDDIPF